MATEPTIAVLHVVSANGSRIRFRYRRDVRAIGGSEGPPIAMLGEKQLRK
jgi:hypothetical protein